MSPRPGTRRLRPTAAAVAFTLLGLVVFVSLGFWQLGRAGAKRAQADAFIAGAGSTVDATGRDLDVLPRYQHVRLRGRYDAARQILLDNMPSPDGRPGYRVLTPFARADGRGWILVDRGWIPLGATREARPDLRVAGEERTVSGLLDELPVPGVRVGPAAAPGRAEWPQVLLFPTPGDVESALGHGAGRHIVRLDASAADGYRRDWRPSPDFGPERHVAYAVQWFAFALVTILLFVALNLRREGDAGHRSTT
jgi:surfeit locus 1 family protein